MKILWVVNMPVGAMAKRLGLSSTSGQWLNAELEKETKSKKNEIIVCSSGSSADDFTEENIRYIMLPHGNVSQYSAEPHIGEWKDLLNSVLPDLIIIWGTEYDIGRATLIANAKKIPSAIYIQGVMGAIAKNYRCDLTDEEINSFKTPVEILRHRTAFDIEASYYKRAEYEKEMVELSGNVIIENSWAQKQYEEMLPSIKIYHNRLPIKKVFAEYQWKSDDFKSHSIITTAATYPLKGLHKLLKAFKLVVEKYPDARLSVPGKNNIMVSGIKNKLVQSGYCKFVKKYIVNNNLQSSVDFIGALTSEQYAKAMQESEIFISASSIENHSSSLREAMSVGIPCIASDVGGISDFASDHKNCSLYDYSDSNQLAQLICELFENQELKKKYSTEGKATIEKMYSVDSMPSLDEIYEEIIKK